MFNDSVQVNVCAKCVRHRERQRERERRETEHSEEACLLLVLLLVLLLGLFLLKGVSWSCRIATVAGAYPVKQRTTRSIPHAYTLCTRYRKRSTSLVTLAFVGTPINLIQQKSGVLRYYESYCDSCCLDTYEYFVFICAFVPYELYFCRPFCLCLSAVVSLLCPLSFCPIFLIYLVPVLPFTNHHKYLETPYDIRYLVFFSEVGGPDAISQPTMVPHLLPGGGWCVPPQPKTTSF